MSIHKHTGSRSPSVKWASVSGLGCHPALSIAVILIISSLDLQLTAFPAAHCFDLKLLPGGRLQVSFCVGKLGRLRDRLRVTHLLGLLQICVVPKVNEEEERCSFGMSWEKGIHPPTPPGCSRDTSWTLLGPQASSPLRGDTQGIKSGRWGVSSLHSYGSMTS